jgi:hypothetical protein
VIPLDHATPERIVVRQQGPVAATGVVDVLDKQWRVTVELGDGSIRSDWQWGARDRVSASGGVLELPVPSQNSGDEVAAELRRAVALCEGWRRPE